MTETFFGQNGNATFTFQVVAVENQFFLFLMFFYQVTLINHFVNQCSLAVVNVCDNRNISYVLHSVELSGKSTHFWAKCYSEVLVKFSTQRCAKLNVQKREVSRLLTTR